MKEEDDEPRRVRFYGVHDLAAGWYSPRVAEIAVEFDPENPPTNIVDVLELHNVQQYLEHGSIPSTHTDEERHRLVALVPQIRSAVARFFTGIDSSNFAAIVAEVDYEYHRDLLDLLGRNKVFARCKSEIALQSLKAAGVHLGELLASRSLVQAYDTELRDELLVSPRGAEYLVRKYLEKDARGEVHLPRSFTSMDARILLARYIDADEANLNYVRLIATARDNAQAGIDAKLRLRAKRRSEVLNAEIFARNEGYKTGSEVSISDVQDEPIVLEVDTSDGSVWRYTYGGRWLEDTIDNPSILNNFQHLFEFGDRQVLLTLPSYPAGLGVMERTVGLTGNAEYKVGSAFRTVNSRSMVQTLMYRQFLESHDIDLEQVISWFCGTYLLEEFGISEFSFIPSAGGSSYLQKVRHLFAEMESLANQFGLFVENGELDRDLLTIGADQIRYKEIPSLLKGKYVYPSEGSEIASILNLLFSDQSTLTYIDETLRADNAARLLLENQLTYTDFHHYQKASVDHLNKLGVLQDTGARVQFVSGEQLLILAALFNTQAANYYHLSEAGRAEADSMAEKGWVVRRSSLLTVAEGDYFNYFLNMVGFSNGPNLRNRYLHGVQAGGENDDAHFKAYVVALRLTVAFVIKMNDDLCLSEAESSDSEG
ncbi:hypothetical protein [Cryobacterium sp. TMT2-42-4]|uniref:hypothetical protein n=1 Tax=Cryobacterium sp. TMT2-42-4 TaxID=1259255 RepID=UPI0010699B36|nr:hypothetical protein [Cryobacterium sp. TMT2-42-4]TFC35314.1 hypothetical protein E3O18_09270 [Cryobacterium sp. TMT2-42-4]